MSRHNALGGASCAASVDDEGTARKVKRRDGSSRRGVGSAEGKVGVFEGEGRDAGRGGDGLDDRIMQRVGKDDRCLRVSQSIEKFGGWVSGA